MPSKPIIGVYLIRHHGTGKVYVGSSRNIGGRWRQHRSMLRRGIHTNSYLQAAWDKHGEAAFVFQIVEKCTLQDIYILEASIIDQHRALDRKYGYNLDGVCASGARIVSTETRVKLGNVSRGRVASVQTRALMSLALRGRPKTDEHKCKIGDAQRGVPRNGHPQTHETRQRISTAQMGEKNHAYGKPLTEEHRRKCSEALKGEGNPNFGKAMTSEQKGKISRTKMGTKQPLDAVAKTAAANRGQKRTPEQRERLRQGRLAYLERKRNGEA